jgi:tetratricopeptide (TPR) repeat protein
LSGVFDCDISAGRHVVTIGSPSYPEYNKYLDVDVPPGASVYLRVSTVVDFSGTIEDSKQAAIDVQSMHVVPAQCSALDLASQEKAAAVASAPDVGDVIARGTAAEQQGDLAEALTIYTDALQRYETRLEAVPDIVDRAIDVALSIRNVPIPDAAKRQIDAASDAIRNAKTRADLTIARRDYANALAQAPWWSDAWFNLSKLDGQIGAPADVRRDLTWYLRSAPDAPDRDTVQKQIEGMR